MSPRGIEQQISALPSEGGSRGSGEYVKRPSTKPHFTDWNCRAGQNNVIIRTDGTVAPCFPMYPSTFDWGNIDNPKFDQQQLKEMKQTCERHCFPVIVFENSSAAAQEKAS
jgi:Iron-sulfur cluster-binding domain